MIDSINNEFFQGGLLLVLLGGIIAALRFLPVELWRLTQRYFTATLYVRDETLVRWLSDWLHETESRKSSWWMGEVVSRNGENNTVLLKPGEGLHIVRRFGVRFLVWSSLEENGIQGKIHTFTLRCYGRDPSKLNRMMDDVRALALERVRGKNVVFINNIWGEWRQIRLGSERRLDSIILPGQLLEEIRSDLATFVSSKAAYAQRGSPYRRGYLFQGPPGNGKSTIVQGISTEFKLPIYALSIADRDFSDTKLANAVGSVPEKAILLLEDADRIDFDRTGVTMSGLLNAVDGALASEGRVLIVTANDPSALDTAFKREGRLDRTWTIPNPDRTCVIDMCERFYANEPCETLEMFADLAISESWSMARVQGQLQRGALSNSYELIEVGQ